MEVDISMARIKRTINMGINLNSLAASNLESIPKTQVMLIARVHTHHQSTREVLTWLEMIHFPTHHIPIKIKLTHPREQATLPKVNQFQDNLNMKT
jgi:hypothetical protein